MVKSNEKEVVKESYFKQVKGELKKVKWPTRKELIKYTISTLVFVIFFALFFYGIETLFAFVKGLIG